MQTQAIRLLALATLATIGGGCSNSDDPATPATPLTTAVTIPFEAEANGQPVDCDTQLTGLGTQSTTATLKDFRFYVHDLAVVTSLGNTRTVTLENNNWQLGADGVALVDFQNKADTCSGDTKDTHKSITGTVPLLSNETISGVQFRIGVPAGLNHQNAATAATPLNLTSLFWSWQTGYKFMRLDVAPVGGMTRPSDASFTGTTWNIHLGSTNCTGDAQAGADVVCERSNRPLITLSGFDPLRNHVFLDYDALVAATDLTQDVAGPAGCMSGLTDPECNVIFAALGLDFTSGNVDPSLTTVFSVR